MLHEKDRTARVKEFEIAIRAAMMAENEKAQAYGLTALALAVLSDESSIDKVLFKVADSLGFERYPMLSPPLPTLDEVENIKTDMLDGDIWIQGDVKRS